MKKLFIWLAIIAVPAYAATTFTTNYNLNKPGDGDTNYGQLVRDNMDTIDTVMDANADATTDHITDTTAAHAASSISATPGAIFCTTETDVQAYLDCLDALLDPSSSGLVTITGAQTITGVKTFSNSQIFSSVPSAAILSTDGLGTMTLTDFNTVDSLTTKGDVAVHNGTDSTRLPVGTDDQRLVADSAQPTGLSWEDQNPKWRKFTLTFASFSSASPAFGVTIFQLAAGEGLDSVLVKHNTPFTGGTTTAYTVETGISGDNDLYSGTYDVRQATAGTVSQITNTLNVTDFDSTTDVVVTATASGGNLDQASAGTLDIYVRTFTLP